MFRLLYCFQLKHCQAVIYMKLNLKEDDFTCMGTSCLSIEFQIQNSPVTRFPWRSVTMLVEVALNF
jgi:hypothetical protein